MKWKVHLQGTTSARSGDIFSKAVLVLESFKEFWEEYPNENWSKNKSLQMKFASKLKEKKAIDTKLNDIEKLSKFARQKSSHFEQMGLLDANRRITSLGYILLTPGKYGEYKAISNGNAAFLIGMLNYKVGQYYLVRDFLKEISKTSKISIENFCKNYMVENSMSDDELLDIIDSELSLDNFEAFNRLIPHQKGLKFNKNYFDIFKKILLENKPSIVFKIISSVSTKFWKCLKKELFGTTIAKDAKKFIFELNERNLALAFLKAKLAASIEEYWNMWSINFEATGVFSITKDMIYLSQDFSKVVNSLELQMAGDITSIKELFTDPTEYENFKFDNISLNQFITKNREDSFNKYLQNNLSTDVLISFLRNMDKNDYYEIHKFFNESANDPTYAEFIVSLSFHIISGKVMNFTEAWNGSLSADNKPLHYATGSKPDAQFYIDEKTYLIETTKMSGQQQTTNEVTPISNHLFSDNKYGEKMAILFAKNIFGETKRQMMIQRNSDVQIFGREFSWLANKLEEQIQLGPFINEVTNV